jgi:hypothetical protein
MPIRYVDQRSAVGRIDATLGDFSCAMPGTHVAPPSRTGTIAAGMQPFTCEMPGVFLPAANRTGIVDAELDSFTCSLQGTFTANTVQPFFRLFQYNIGGDHRYDTDAWINAAARFSWVVTAQWPGWEIGKTRTARQVCQEVHSRSLVGTKVFAYLIHESVHKSSATAGNALWPIFNQCQTHGLWAWTNGLTETGQVDSYDSANYQINHSLQGKLVAGERAYQWIVRWYKSWLVDGATIFNGVVNLANVANPDLDGAFIDNYFPYFKSPQADMDRNGSVDNYASAGSITLAQTSQIAASNFLRAIWPDKEIIGNTAEWTATNSDAYNGLLDGGIIEGGIGQSYSYETNTSFQAYIDHIAASMDRYGGQKRGGIVNILDSLTNYSLMRYSLCAAALTNAACHHSLIGLQSENLPATWYDEYSFNLGQPAPGPDGAVQTAPRYQAGAGGQGIWRRDFTNGIVLCAARRSTFTNLTAYAAQALGGTFYRLGVTQDPVTNNGQPISSITMIPRTGIVLARAPYDLIAPTVPTGLTASPLSSSAISLSWNASTDTGGSGLAGYRIERSANGTTGWTEVQQVLVPTTTYANPNLASNTLYFYRIRSYDGAGNLSGYSASVSATTSPAAGVALFSDSFALGNRSHTQNGVRWWQNGVNSTVVADPGNSTGWALRLRMPARPDVDGDAGDSWAEQRFYFGQAGTDGAYTDLWFKYRVLIPLNYFHRQASFLTSNNKFIRVWKGNTVTNPSNDGYTAGHYHLKGGFSTDPLSPQGAGSRFRAEFGSDTSGNGVGLSGTNIISTGPLISPADLGQEVTYVMHIKTDTAGVIGAQSRPTGGNGALGMWKNGVQLIHHTTLAWRTEDGLHEFFEYGYVFGYANSGFLEQTDILLRELTIATTNIFGVT